VTEPGAVFVARSAIRVEERCDVAREPVQRAIEAALADLFRIDGVVHNEELGRDLRGQLLTATATRSCEFDPAV
jgi:hypothetical protein